MLCILSSASLSRTWAVFDLNGVDTKLPLDCTDEEILDEAAAMAGLERRKMRFEETPMTSLIIKMKLAVLARKMVRASFCAIVPAPVDAFRPRRTTAPSASTPCRTRRSSRWTPSCASSKRPSRRVTSCDSTRLVHFHGQLRTSPSPR